jgi:hypothetical protein
MGCLRKQSRKFGHVAIISLWSGYFQPCRSATGGSIRCRMDIVKVLPIDDRKKIAFFQYFLFDMDQYFENAVCRMLRCEKII